MHVGKPVHTSQMKLGSELIDVSGENGLRSEGSIPR